MSREKKHDFTVPAGAGRTMFVFVNVLVWIIILSFPFVMATRDGLLVELEKYVIYSWIPLMFMLVFYLNYYFLVDKLILEKRLWWLFLLCNVATIVIVSVFSHLMQEFYLTQVVSNAAAPQGKMKLLTYIIRDGMVLTLVIGLSVALKMVIVWRKHETERDRLESEKRDAELQNLRSQLNPHFLFNTLNNIYGLTLSDAGKAREAIHSLSSILRYILYDNENRVPLDKELDFIRNYIELMRLRTNPNVTVETTLPSDDQGVMIAPLVFMTLVENGFKHGVSQDEPSFVRIAIDIVPLCKGRLEVTCTVENSFFPKTDADRSGSGIGVDNLRRRLALLYPKNHTLSLDREGDTFVAKLTIKL